MKKEYYIASVSHMRENAAKLNLENQVLGSHISDCFGEILIPIKKITKIDPESGKSRSYTKKVYPGYIFIEMFINEDTIQLVHSTKYIKYLLSYDLANKRPIPLTSKEKENIILISKDPRQVIDSIYHSGQRVRITKGFLSDLQGLIESVDNTKSLCKVSVNILGRNSSFDIPFENLLLEDN